MSHVHWQFSGGVKTLGSTPSTTSCEAEARLRGSLHVEHSTNTISAFTSSANKSKWRHSTTNQARYLQNAARSGSRSPRRRNRCAPGCNPWL